MKYLLCDCNKGGICRNIKNIIKYIRYVEYDKKKLIINW